MRPEYRDAIRFAIVVLLVGAGTIGHAFGQSVHTTPVTDGDVRAAVARATEFLYSRQDSQGAFPNRHSTEYVGGGEALAAFALLAAGQSPDDPRLRRTLEYLKAQQPAHTYIRSLRTIVYSHLTDRDYRTRLIQDVQWLLKQQHPDGGWGYGPGSTMTRLRPEWTDASNSQFALLALREASDAGLPIPQDAWRQAELYWRKLQNADGGWGYQSAIRDQPPQRPDSHGSMTTAGVATYFILADKLGPRHEKPFQPNKRRGHGRPARDVPRGRLAFSDQIHRGLAWLQANYKIDQNPRYVWMAMPGQLFCYLFCLQRVGDAAGMRTFGDNDYAAGICQLLLARQKPNGSWDDSVIDTSFALLCLAKASSPIIINRLELGKGPGRDPRDAANLARWLSHALGRPLAWQRVGGNSLEGLSDAPLLYINGPDRPALPEKMAETFKQFIRNGGTCLVQARPGDSKFVESFQQYCLNLFPDYRRQDIGPDHPVFSLRFRIAAKGRPRIVGIGDKCRTRIFILTDDVSGAWHQGLWRKFEHLFQLAGNIALYSTADKMPPGRLAARLKPLPPPPVKRFINVARLKYDGDYNVCPLAIERLGGVLAHSLPIGLKELPPADPAGKIDTNITLLWLTGNVPPRFTVEQLANIREYLQAGGTLLIDPAIGRADFHAAAGKMLEAMFSAEKVHPLLPQSSLITGQFAGGIGADLRKVRLLRSDDKATTKPTAPKLSAITLKGRIAVVLSTYGLTCSVEGNPCVENVGYTTPDARKIVLNVILYAATSR